MKFLLLSVILIITLWSCSKNLYGTYNTKESKDKNAFFQIKLNTDNTVEKTEIHTISDFANGKFLILANKKVVCYFDSSINKFPPDTLAFKTKGKNLYFITKGKLNRKAFLVKQ